MNDKSNELAQGLKQFTGTEQVFFNPLYRWMKYTDGVKYFAETAGAYWLLDIIGTELKKLVNEHEFLLIELAVLNNAAELKASNGDEENVYNKHIEYTDCPTGKWEFYLIVDTLLLPSEY